MAASAKFWDKIAEKYAKQPVADEAAYQKKLEITRGYFTPDMEVLELGCGTGSTALAHAPYVKHILATDISSKMIAIARDKAAAENIGNVTFEQATVESLSVPDDSLDAVLALSLLHLLEDKDAAIAKVHRMLKPGGIFVTSTACLGDSMWWLVPVLPVGRMLGFFPLVKVFTQAHLRTSLTGAGFTIDHDWQPEKSPAVFIIAKKAP